MTSEDNHAGATSNNDEDVGWVRLDVARALEDESAMHVDIGEYGLCVARSLGAVHALHDECTHGQVPLSEGDVEGGYVECWMHGSQFDLSTGAPTGPPATEPVAVYPVRINGDHIEVRLPVSQDWLRDAHRAP